MKNDLKFYVHDYLNNYLTDLYGLNDLTALIDLNGLTIL